MSAPHPPQGRQQQYTERPLRVLGEQYLEGESLPIGAVINPGDPPLWTDDKPRVLLPSGPVELHDGDWIISNRYTGVAVEVIGPEEFSERFGPGGGP